MKLRHAIALISVIWAALYLPFLGSHEIRGEEPRRILPARTMLQTGDFIVPRVGGEVYSRKPPLINWTIAGMFALTGDSVWSARFPSILWILAFALVAAWALRDQFGVWRAAMAGLFFLTAFGVLDKGRMAEIEAMFVAQTGIAFLLWLRWWTQGRRWLAYTAPWLLLGLGLLAKGPVHLIFFYPIVLATLWKAGRLREALHPAHFCGLLLMAAVFAPWAILNQNAVGSAEETSGVWIQQFMARLTLDDVDFGAWLLRPLEMAKDFLPWTVLLIWAWKIAKLEPRNSRKNWDFAMGGARFGIVFGFALICLAPKGEARYVMPVFPIAAVVLTDLLGRVGHSRLSRLEERWRRGNMVAAGVLSLVAILAIWLVPRFGPAASVWLAGCAAGLALATLAIALRRKNWHPLIGTSFVLAASIFLFFVHATPLEAENAKYRPLARDLEAKLGDDDGLLAFYDPGNLRFLVYVRHPYVEAARVAHMPENPRFLAVRPKDLKQPKIQRYLEPFQTRQIADFEWERKQFVLLRLAPAP